MKKFIPAIVFTFIIVALIAYFGGLMMGLTYDPSATYESPAIVAEVDEELGWITLIDWNGEAWCIRGEGYEVNELVIVTFNNNQTETIYDDMIVKVERGNIAQNEMEN